MHMRTNAKGAKLAKAARSLFGRCRMLVVDFDGVLTDNGVYLSENGMESVRCDRGDGLGLEMVRQTGCIDTLILSRESNSIVKVRAKKLKLPVISGASDKLKILKRELLRRKLSPERVCYVGNDVNDIECMKYVGIPVAVADSHPKAIMAARYVTRRGGGRGAVREVCDVLISSL